MYYIYWNISRQLFSVRQDGIVIGYFTSALLRNATFKVNQKGRMQVRKEKRKNVHAFVCTTEIFDVTKWDCALFDKQDTVTYNPYKHRTFVRVSNRKPIREAEWVYLRTLVNEEGQYYPDVAIGKYLKPQRLTVQNQLNVLRRLARLKGKVRACPQQQSTK